MRKGARNCRVRSEKDSVLSLGGCAVAEALLLSFLAGLAMVVGGLAAASQQSGAGWLARELRHAVIAFGGGALLAAVALVMVPDGLKFLSAAGATVSFAAGALCFMGADWLVQRSGGSAAQLMAMLLDFVPEAVALGAAFASGSAAGPLLAFLIGLQNLPEGFNAFHEIRAKGTSSRRRVLTTFVLLSLLGPAAAWLGITTLGEKPALLAYLMMFSGGGILYLTFQDIAPQAKLERAWGPALGAVAGFLLGLLGQVLLIGGGTG